jgi:YbbR domain-containing protein
VKFLRWLARNFGTLLTAFVLAVIVWVSAVIASDPDEEHLLARPVPIEIIGQDPGLQIMGDVPQTVSVVLRAPTSVWTQLNNDPSTVTARIDLSGLGAGTYTLPVQVQITPHPVRLISQDPEHVSIALESIVSQVFPVDLVVTGNPPVGYQAQTPLVNPEQVTVTGAESLVSMVKQAVINLDITNASQTIIRSEVPVLLDAEGQAVSGLTITPGSVLVTQPITLLGGYRYVIVRAVTEGQVATGYRVTNIYVSPIGVVVFSSDPELVNNLPGYVETQPIDLTGKDDDFETLVDLNLPTGITVVGDSKVLVQVSIAMVESSLAISLPVEIIGLSPGLAASVDPPIGAGARAKHTQLHRCARGGRSDGLRGRHLSVHTPGEYPSDGGVAELHPAGLGVSYHHHCTHPHSDSHPERYHYPHTTIYESSLRTLDGKASCSLGWKTQRWEKHLV